jgi:hypothetical protein
MNTLFLRNKPIWEQNTFDPCNTIGKQIVDDGRRTKMITQCRIEVRTDFDQLLPTPLNQRIDDINNPTYVEPTCFRCGRDMIPVCPNCEI